MRRFANHRRHPGKFGVMFLIFSVVMALVVMTLWNAIIPGLFGLKAIGFWTALGLLVLCRVLFGGMGMGPMMFRMARDHRQLHERWMNMSEEERQAFFQKRQRWGGRDGWRCGPGAPTENEPPKPSDNA
ncbi:hypothetical protein TUM17576_27180 [Enterobacter hormaechei]|uniref:Uncharacterized protein n=1 Tax=Phytobacter ursingii TaxID=1972431 RepID=A0AB35RVE9_9ENTR|nr:MULTISPECIES: hypothetical protein [Enterobacteriaceae]MDV2863927.1 hypothetical protein [Phytobacter ursingii]GJL35898.1 hypothetical protein TUM17576_27180 [Enterobacter hormaechei]